VKMNFLKTLGKRTYYQVRRMKKALKNWRKFGVVIFGSLFVLSNVIAPYMPAKSAIAEGKVSYLYINPSTLSVKEGDSFQFNYRAEDENHNVITVTPNWSVNVGTAGSINSTGRFTASHNIGTYNNAVKLSAGTLSTYAKVVVYRDTTPPIPPTDPKVSYLYIIPPTLTIEEGQGFQFGYRAEDENHNPISVTPNWSMNNSAAGTINSTGYFTASHNIGTHGVAVKLVAGALAVYAKVIITPSDEPTVTLSRVDIVNSAGTSVSSFSIDPNQNRQLYPKAYDTEGNDITSITSFVWNIDSDYNSTEVGTISQSGLYSAGNRAGYYSGAIRLSGSYNGKTLTDTASVTINQSEEESTLMSVVVSPSYTVLDQNATRQFTAIAYDQFNHQITSGVDYTWSVIHSGGTINSYSGLFTAGNTAGTFDSTVRVRASMDDQVVYDYATVTVNEIIVQSSLDYVESYPSSITISHNQSFDFDAQAYDTNHSPLFSNVTYSWRIISGSGSINQSGLYQANDYAGTATVEVKAMQGTIERYDTSVVTVIDGPDNNTELSYVVLTPQTVTLNTGASTYFSAQAYNSAGNTVSATYTWDVINSQAGYINQSGYFTASNNIGTYYNTVRVRAYRNGIERSDYADVIVRTGGNDNNYGIDATLIGSDDNGGSAMENDVITYTLRITNNRSTTLSNVRATFDVPEYTSFISASSSSGGPTISGRTITWILNGNLYASETRTMTVRVVINSVVPRYTVIRAKAFITASEIANGIWVYANDITVAGSGQPIGPLTPTGAINWILAMIASFLAAIVAYKVLQVRNKLRFVTIVENWDGAEEDEELS
jgi:uncharacterized repeat protein (TIGR01451 family)